MDLLENISSPTEVAVKHFIDVILCQLHPKVQAVDSLIQNFETRVTDSNDELKENKHLYLLCNDQMVKCASLMVDIFRLEIKNSQVLKDTRHWVLGRVKCCLDKLGSLNAVVLKALQLTDSNASGSQDADSQFKEIDNIDKVAFKMSDDKSFISWVDDALKLFDLFEVLFESDLNILRMNDENWRTECSKALVNFHRIIRELISSAFNICQNCLVHDQHIINARCHVVLREAKNLISEIIEDPRYNLGENQDLNVTILKIKNNLHNPTIRMFNDILRDAVCNLEMSVNKGVLSLVIKCLNDPLRPLENLKQWQTNNETLQCLSNTDSEMDYIDAFDVHNDQIVQIGLFAISCSGDSQRVLQLKSCLASLETLEDHLVPSLLSNSSNLHIQFLADNWTEEVLLLRNCVFLIIDPGAFIELAVTQMREKINSLKNDNLLNLDIIRCIISLGKCVSDFFHAYFKYEPKIYQENITLHQIVENLDMAKKECLAVVELFLINSTEESNKNVLKESKTIEVKVHKRLKLLYTLILKIASEINHESSSFENEDTNESEIEQNQRSSITHNKYSEPENVPKKNKGVLKIFDLFKNQSDSNTKNRNDLNLIKKTNKKDLFSVNKTYSRTTIIRKNLTERTKRFIHHLNDIDEPCNIPFDGLVSISGFLNETKDKQFYLANISINETNKTSQTNPKETKKFEMNRSIFYGDKTNRKNASLRRKVLLNRANEAQKRENYDKTELSNTDKHKQRSIESLNISLDLHVTDILEQISKLSDTISLLKMDHTIDHSFLEMPENKMNMETADKNVLTLKINENTYASPKKVWSIKISNDIDKSNTEDKENQQSNNSIDCGIDVSFGSDIPTPERINDLHKLEQKLAKLKAFSCKK